MVAITPTDPTYRACFGDTGPDLHAMTDAEYEAFVNGPKEAYDIDRGRDICDAFERDVKARADAAMNDCHYVIPETYRAAWYERFLLIAAVELTETIDADHPF